MRGRNAPGTKPALKVDESDLETGRCATCDSKVRWPRGATEFRCATCLMINDLRSIPSKPGRTPRNTEQALQRAATSASPLSSARVPELSLERTQGIIDRCILAYLSTSTRQKLKLPDNQIVTPPASPSFAASVISPAAHLSPNAAIVDSSRASGLAPSMPHAPTSSRPRSPVPRQHGRSQDSSPVPKSAIARKPIVPTQSSLPSRPNRDPPAPPSQSLNVPVSDAISRSASRSRSPISGNNRSQGTPTYELDDKTDSGAKYIFKALEDYIIRGFGEYECLNRSFAPRRHPVAHDHKMYEDLGGRPVKSLPSADVAVGTSLSELDAKMLLLGDVAENGSWWTGGDERTKDPLKQDKSSDSHGHLVSSKSPSINWADVLRWYHDILNAGRSWRRVFDDHDELDREILEDTAALRLVEDDLHHARMHVHRVLLKASEALLKRPGRPLKSPNEIRFLLIMLSNPLLYPHGTQNLTPVDHPADPSVVRGKTSPDIDSAWDRGQAFGIVKRILGLIANLPIECHRYLTGWFTRIDEERFRLFVDLIQRFVTYRLKRQHGRKKSSHNPVGGLIPTLSGTGSETSAQLHAALGLTSKTKEAIDKKSQHASYSDDWQVKVAAKTMSLFFGANKNFGGHRSSRSVAADASHSQPGSVSRTHIKIRGQLLSTSEFYNTMLDYADLVADFDIWEANRGSFAFCQYPFFLSVGSKIKIMEHDARRQMDIRAREAFFNSITHNKQLRQYLHMKVRRDCIAEDSLKSIREIVGTGQEEIKKGLKVEFIGEEGIDAGGLRKEWFLLLIREIFDPQNGMFVYDDESRFCYFNPNSFESSEQYFLVGALLGLAIYNSTILDVALPPFTFKKLLTAGPIANAHRPALYYALEDLAEFRPSLAKGLAQLLEFDGDVEETFCRDFVVETERYGVIQQIPLGPDGARRPVNNSNRQEFVDLYVRYVLDEQVARQFEPFKRGFFTVCGGNALSLFQPEEIELLVRGSDESLDVPSLKGVAVYDNWKKKKPHVSSPAEEVLVVRWFWEFFESAAPQNQRKILGFITGSDRIPAVGATSLIIKVSFAGFERERYPIARTCFNQILLYDYERKEELQDKLWRAVMESEGFGLK